MELYPAIDLRQGRVVRLSQGEAARLTAYDDDPLAVAERFVAAGARWLHLVDLDRAFGDGDNDAVVRRLAGHLGAQVRIQLGGGLRSIARIEALGALGIARLVIGTSAVTSPDLVPAAIAAVGAARLAVGIDARSGRVAVRGWTATSDVSVEDLAAQVIEAGVDTLIYTDIDRDGMLTGPDLDGAARLQALGGQVIASGGVGRLDDITAASARGLGGIIVGRALYEGRFSIAQALEAARGTP